MAVDVYYVLWGLAVGVCGAYAIRWRRWLGRSCGEPVRTILTLGLSGDHRQNRGWRTDEVPQKPIQGKGVNLALCVFLLLFILDGTINLVGFPLHLSSFARWGWVSAMGIGALGEEAVYWIGFRCRAQQTPRS